MRFGLAGILNVALMGPALAQNPPITLDKQVGKLTLRAVFTFGPAHPGECSLEQQRVLADKIAGTLDLFTDRLVQEAVAARPDIDRQGGIMELRLTGGCGAGGGVTLGGEAPDSPLRFEYFEPGRGWEIIG